MANIVTSIQFDMQKLANKFPGKLIFKGSPAELPGETEIMSHPDISAEELEVGIKECILNPDLRNQAAKLPFLVHVNEVKVPKLSPIIMYQIASVVVSVLIVFIFHWIGVL